MNDTEVPVPAKTPPSRKTQSLKQQGCLNRQAESVRDPVFEQSEFFDAEDVVQVKYEMLRRVEIEQSSVTESASAFGFSRLTFYQTKEAFQREGLHGLVPKKTGPRRPHKLRPEVMAFVREQLEEEPRLSWSELAQRVQAHFELKVHPRSIERSVQKKKRRRRKTQGDEAQTGHAEPGGGL